MNNDLLNSFVESEYLNINLINEICNYINIIPTRELMMLDEVLLRKVAGSLNFCRRKQEALYLFRCLYQKTKKLCDYMTIYNLA